MEAVITIKQFDGRTYWLAERFCLSNEEAKAAKALLDAMPAPEAYLPHHAAIAIADGFPATGGGLATHHVEPAPELTPALAALAESQLEDPPLNGPDSPGEAAP